jgi:diguanylate cyclase (GGDEF)-like protein
MLCRQGCPLTAVLEGSEVENHEMYVRCRDGSRRPVAVTATPVRDEDGRIVGAVEVFRDNREKLAVEEERERALRLACLDALTGVANRRRMERTLENYLAEGYVARAPGVLLLLDVDHFKKVNDTCGHEAGDAVLRTVARTLEGCVRVGDTVGRWGGEEFVVLLAATTREQGKEIAERLRCQVERTVTRVGEQEMGERGIGERGIGERGIVVTCSVGGAVIEDGDTVRTLVRRSDEQMYRAKKEGRNRVCFAEGGQAGRGEAEGSETEGSETEGSEAGRWERMAEAVG